MVDLSKEELKKDVLEAIKRLQERDQLIIDLYHIVYEVNAKKVYEAIVELIKEGRLKADFTPSTFEALPLPGYWKWKVKMRGLVK